MNKIIFVCFCLLLNHAHADTMGTVFYSPAERAALLSARNGIATGAVYSLYGIVQRGAGKSAAWINGRALTESPRDPAIPTLVIKRDHVLIGGKVIKVGETLDIVTGQHVVRIPEKSVRETP